MSIIYLPVESPLKKETVRSLVDILGGTKVYFRSFCLSPDSINGEISTADDLTLQAFCTRRKYSENEVCFKSNC